MVCEKLNIPFDGYLPKAKGFFRDDNRPYYEFLNAEQMQIIRECNSNVIDLLGYSNENQNNHKISILGESKKQLENYTEEYYNQRGYLLKEQGKLDEALIAYAQAIGINPKKYWAYYHTLGGIFAENNLYKEAVLADHQAIKIKPDFAWTHYHLAVVLEKQGKLDEASTFYQNAFQLYPSLSYYKNKL
ncbi:MAG: tetratricopeptide repeat protein [Trichodesmium sp. MAG_R03]|nr:tetratricopeptide repeat protein [Trichodesmium sp. MAG_R03]